MEAGAGHMSSVNLCLFPLKQVFPGAWTAILASLDNVGVWNLRTENLDRWYQGQETYLRIVNPEENGETEMAAPDNVLYCGSLKQFQKYIFLKLFKAHFMIAKNNLPFSC